MGLAWSGVLAVEGVETGDDRIFDKGALTWELLPLPLRWCSEDMGEHGGAVHVGWINEMSRSGDQILGSGDIFDESFAEYLNQAGQIGVSIDPDNIEYSIEIEPEVAGAPEPATAEGLAMEGGTVEIPDELMVIHVGRIRAATAVDIPAFIDAVIKPGLPVPGAAAPPAPVAPAAPPAAAASTAEFAVGDAPPVPAPEVAPPSGDNPPAPEAQAAPTHAGLVVAASDTGRILMIQRVLDPADPAGGTWEFPGGSIDAATDPTPYDGAKREFTEETGLPAPDGDPDATWLSADGVYQAFVKSVPVEAEAFAELNPDLAAAEGINPDDPQRKMPEVTAWMDPATLDGWAALRPEVQMCLPDLSTALGGLATAPAALVASSGPTAPPSEWFAPFELEGPTPLTVTEDGRVFGHLASWSSCHADYADACVTPPHDPTPEFFHLGTVLTAEGTSVPVGRITVGGGHAARDKTLRAALEHYDNASTCAAVVQAHEDKYGIALFGAVVPEATPEQVAALRRSPLSADWRKAGGRFRLTAAHAVNSPGYPILHTALVAATGGPESLVVTGRVTLHRNVVDLNSARERIARSIGRDKQSRRAELAARVHGQMGD